MSSDNASALYARRDVSRFDPLFLAQITYDGNTIINAEKNGLVIQQDYLNGGPTGIPTNELVAQAAWRRHRRSFVPDIFINCSVPIKNVKFTGAKTTISVTSKATPVSPNVSGGRSDLTAARRKWPLLRSFAPSSSVGLMFSKLTIGRSNRFIFCAAPQLVLDGTLHSFRPPAV